MHAHIAANFDPREAGANPCDSAVRASNRSVKSSLPRGRARRKSIRGSARARARRGCEVMWRRGGRAVAQCVPRASHRALPSGCASLPGNVRSRSPPACHLDCGLSRGARSGASAMAPRGFDYELSARDAALAAGTAARGAAAAGGGKLPKAKKTGTTIAGVVFKVSLWRASRRGRAWAPRGDLRCALSETFVVGAHVRAGWSTHVALPHLRSVPCCRV